MRAIIYCRVSTKEQVSNLSLPTQLKACREYCRRNSFDVAEEFVEQGESAKTAERPELQRLLTYCQAKKHRIAVVIVYNLSRFTRKQYDHVILRAKLRAFGITVRSVTEPIDDSPVGSMMEGIISAFAQFDNDIKADRTKAGMREALTRGRWTFIAPLGYLNGGNGCGLVPDPERWPLVRRAFELLASGDHTKRDVLRRVTALGLRTRKGKPLTPQTFNALLRNPLYAGHIRVPGFDVNAKGAFEALVPPGLFTRVQQILDGRVKGTKIHLSLNPDFPLRRFVRCGDCNSPLTGGRSKGRNKSYPYYHCYRCNRVRVRKERLEAAFVRKLEELQPSQAYMKLFRAVILDAWNQRRKLAQKDQERLTQRIGELNQRIDVLEEEFIFLHRIEADTYQRQQTKLREQLKQAENELQLVQLDDLDVEAALDFAEVVVTDAARFWENALSEQKQRLQLAFFPEGLRFDGQNFGTAPICLAFKEIQRLSVVESAVASPTGFEPVLPP